MSDVGEKVLQGLLTDPHFARSVASMSEARRAVMVAGLGEMRELADRLFAVIKDGKASQSTAVTATADCFGQVIDNLLRSTTGGVLNREEVEEFAGLLTHAEIQLTTCAHSVKKLRVQLTEAIPNDTSQP